MTLIEEFTPKFVERGLNVPEAIILLWLYTSPHGTTRRFYSSIRNILTHCKFLKNAYGEVGISDYELDELIVKTLTKLERKGLVIVKRIGKRTIKASLSFRGIALIEGILSDREISLLRRIGHIP